MRFQLVQSARLAKDLPPRRRQILLALANGLLRKEIADKINISPRTVDSHCQIMYRELGVHSARQAASVAARAGFI